MITGKVMKYPSLNLTQEDYVLIPASHYIYYGGSSNPNQMMMDPSISSVIKALFDMAFEIWLLGPKTSY